MDDVILKMNEDRASEDLMNSTFSDELTAAIAAAMQPMLEKFAAEHPYITLGFEFKLAMSDGDQYTQAIVATLSTMNEYTRRVNSLRTFRTLLKGDYSIRETDIPESSAVMEAEKTIETVWATIKGGVL